MVDSQVIETTLASMVWNAKTPEDVSFILECVDKSPRTFSWRPVGDRENNIGTIRVASDPALALVERVTNGIDALLDLGHLVNPHADPRSPREAAKAWFGIPHGGIADMTPTERRNIGERLQIVLEASGDKKKPTVIIQDEGTGQSPSDFPITLLSLNESNKVRQRWTTGTYGQGGSATFGFSKATIILSRRHPQYTNGRPDSVGWTIVLEQDHDPEMMIMPSYVYLVDDSTKDVFQFSPVEFPDFHNGTRIIHIAYDLQGWSGNFTTGIWQLFHSALFDPLLPFMVAGNQTPNETKFGSRIVTGNAARLNRPDAARGEIEIPHSDSARADLGPKYGAVTYNYWVVRRPDGSTSKSDPTGGYVRPDAAVSLTLFGQRQDAERRTWIKDRARLPFLYKNLIIQVDADDLTPIAKRELFASTRERATSSNLREDIYSNLEALLRSDDELKRLNREEKERLLQRSTSAASEKVRKRLARYVRTRLKDLTQAGTGGNRAGSTGKRTPPSGGRESHRNTADSHLPHVPSQFAFQRKAITVHQGAGSFTWVAINAKNGYLPEHDDDLSLIWDEATPTEKLRLTTRSRLAGGLTRWMFVADFDAPIGTYSLRAELITANGPLTDSIQVTVAVPPPAEPSRSGSEDETGPNVQWVNRDEWHEHDGLLDENAVGYVTEDDEQTIIWINRHFSLLERALSGSSLTAEQIALRSERYQFPVACGLWLQQQSEKGADPRPDDSYVLRERQRLAEAVLMAMDPDVELAMELDTD